MLKHRNYFRFDPAVIDQRKKAILEFLYYCAENPVIYRSQPFVKFFDDPCLFQDEGVKFQEESLRDGMNSSNDASSLQSLVDLQSQHTSSELEAEGDGVKSQTIEENLLDHLSTGSDYLYDAAICFSQAVAEEANLRHKQAFELYKLGIDKLLSGAKNDDNERRKRLANAKASKYLERAEMLYENHFAQQQENESFIFEDLKLDDEPSVQALERPANNLSRFKVIGVNDYKLRVQDCTDKKIYFLKTLFKVPNSAISLPQSIPFMVRLVSYYSTSSRMFLLLPLMTGGLLWDYICTYTNKSEKSIMNIETIFVEPPANTTSHIIPNDYSDIEIVEEISAYEYQPSINFVDNYSETIPIPSFDTLSAEMDIKDLMSCSQMLLQSVSKTLQKSHIDAEDQLSTNESGNLESLIETPADPSVAPVLETEKFSSREVLEEPSEIQNYVEQLPETVLKQWASELVVAVNALHKVGIVCGDLNLNNLLLGPHGHLTLTYFYKSDHKEYQQLCKLNPNAVKCLYVALDFPLTKESDWFSVGVLIYEIFTKERFYLNHPHHFNEIQFSYPDSVSDDLKDLLRGLIINPKDNRLTFNDILQHSFFHGIDFKNVEKCGLELS